MKLEIEVSDELIKLANNLHTQDNRSTAHPSFMVTARERLGYKTPTRVPFFTNDAAAAYIEQNAHDLLTPDIHIASGYQNPEWIAVRDLLMSLLAPAQAAQTVAKVEPKDKRHDDGYDVGDILCSSWGFGQTNIDFVQVVKRSAANTLTLSPLGATPEPCDNPTPMADRVVPDLGVRKYDQPGFSTEGVDVPNKRTLRRSLKFNAEGVPIGFVIAHGWCSSWDGQPQYRSWYN